MSDHELEREMNNQSQKSSTHQSEMKASLIIAPAQRDLCKWQGLGMMHVAGHRKTNPNKIKCKTWNTHGSRSGLEMKMSNFKSNPSSQLKASKITSHDPMWPLKAVGPWNDARGRSQAKMH